MTKNSLLTASQKSNTADNHLSNQKVISDGLSLLVLAIAIIALAFSPIFTKLSEIELSPTATIFNRLWISTIIISFWQLVNTWRSSITNELELSGASANGVQSLDRSVVDLAVAESQSDYQEKGLLILASFSATASAVLWAVSFTQTSIASSTVLRSLTPLFIGLGAWLILKQRFNRQFILGMILAIVGGIVIGWDDLQLGSSQLAGDGIALLSAALHGANILVVGYLRDRGCATDRVLLWRCAGGALMVLPIVYFTDMQLFPISAQGWLVIIALAVVCQTFGQSLLVFSLKHFSSSFVGIFALLKPLITALLAWVIFAEGISIISGVALILILAGIYLAKTSDSATQNPAN